MSTTPERRRLFARLLGGRDRRAFGWGFVDQGFSSATNFGLSVLAGRLLGPAGLGTVFLGFSVYLIFLALQRRLLTEPMLAASARESAEDARASADAALTVSLLAGLGASVALVALGLLIPGFIGRGVVLVAPWIGPALVQDTWRNLLFRDGRPAAAAANDAVWFLGMAAVVPVAYLQGSDWAVVACWGIGAVCGAAMGFFQTRTRPRPVRASVRWARKDAFGFGKWNAGAALVANIGGNASTFVLSIVLGAEALGGLRSAQTIFAPLTLILPAINLPGLPAVARAWVAGPRAARTLAFRLSGLAVAAVGVYLIGLLLGGWRLLSLLFGEDFAGFRNLIPPIAVGQLLTAGAVGWLLLLKAQLRGRVLLVSRATGAVATLVLVGVLASRFGLLGAAWGGTVGAAAQLAITTRAALIPVEPSENETVPAEDQS